VRISVTGHGVPNKTIWDAIEPVALNPPGRVQELSVLLDSRLLPPGIYLAELISLDGEVYQTYIFRVTEN
jgi:hypothetical protein